MSALRSVVFPLPVPPLTRIFRRVCNTRSASCRTFAGNAPCSTSCVAEKDRVPTPPDGDRDVRACGRDTDRHARAVVQTRIKDRRGRRVQAQGPGDMDRGPLKGRRVQPRGVDCSGGPFSCALYGDTAARDHTTTPLSSPEG